MEYVLILIIFGLSLIFLKFIFSYNIKKIEELAKNEKLDEIAKKYPSNIEICKKYLKMLKNEKVEIVEDYLKLYSELAERFPNVKVYIMSVNPINEEKRNKTEPNNKRTTEKIKLFNKLIREKLKDSNLKNMYYCDAYNNLKFDTNDGLHYTQETNEDIIYYISNKCIDY